MGAEAGGSPIVPLQETAPGLGQAEQAQGVTGGRGVKNNVVKACILVRQQRGEFVKGSNLGGAGPGQLLTHGRKLCLARACTHLGEHALAVRLRGCVRVDVEHRQAWGARHCSRDVAQFNAQHFIKVGGRIRADQQDLPARVGQRQRRCSGQRGLANAALAGEEQMPRGRAEKGKRATRRDRCVPLAAP